MIDYMMQQRWIIGIDEVGRGPIAGPVVVCACAFNPTFRKKLSFLGLTDSKKMTPKTREAWFQKAKEWEAKGIISYAIGKKTAAFIDKYGISHAIRASLESALKKLALPPQEVQILLDGSLYAPKEYLFQQTVIRGDLKHKEISLASVIAKVTRDAYMDTLHQKYPYFAWYKNKGYGTRDHYLGLKKEGITDFHRRSFLKSLVIDK